MNGVSVREQLSGQTGRLNYDCLPEIRWSVFFYLPRVEGHAIGGAHHRQQGDSLSLKHLVKQSMPCGFGQPLRLPLHCLIFFSLSKSTPYRLVSVRTSSLVGTQAESLKLAVGGILPDVRMCRCH